MLSWAANLSWAFNIHYLWLMIAYIALFSTLLSRLTVLACDSTWVTSFFFYSTFLNIHQSGVLKYWHGWRHMKLLPSQRKFCGHHTTCHFMQSHIRKVYACLAVTCHLHFGQNDWDISHATAVTRGWNGYRNNLLVSSKAWGSVLQEF